MRKQTSKSLLLVFVLAIAGLFLMPSRSALAANPNLINFQGKIVNADGTNVANASYTFRFCLYTTASPSTPCTAGANNDAVWRESKSISTTNGVFQTELGSVTTMIDVSAYTDLYLGINFNGDADGEMTPRIHFDSVPYALNSDKLGGLASSAFAQLAATNAFTATNTFTLGGTENVALSSDLAGTVDLLSIIGTPSGTAGTTRGLFIQQANHGSNTNGLDTGLVIDNADTDLIMPDGLLISSAAGGITDAIDVSDAEIVNGLNIGANNLAFADGSAFSLTDNNASPAIQFTFKDNTNANGGGVLQFARPKTDTADPTTCSEGDIYYNDADDTIKICHESNVWEGLDGGGGGGNSFTTIDTEDGTDPVADTSSDTLVLTSTGSNLTVTGANDPESVTFDIVESTLAGLGLVANGDALDIVSGNSAIDVNAGDITFDQDFAFSWTADHDFTFTATENMTIANSGASGGSANGLTVTVTPSSIAGTPIGINVRQGGSGNSNALDVGLQVDNQDDGLAITDGILFVNSGGGGFGDFIDTPSSVFKVDGTGVVTAANLTCSSASCISTGEITDATITGDDIASSIAGAGLVLTAGSPDVLDIVSGNAGIVINANDITLDVVTTGTAGATASNSGLEIVAGEGLTLLKGCSDGQVLKWDDVTDVRWECAADASGGGGSPTLDAVLAAAGAGTAQDSNANSIFWNWDFTTAAVDSGLTISESTASTNGTQNQQALLELITLANSTASPLQVTAGGTDVGDVWFDLTGTSDFEIRDAGTAVLTVNDSGQVGIGTGTSAITGSTERLLQVGSETNRGNAAVYGELISKGMKDLTSLSNIKDIFIYDTTTDSDSGRWIDWATTEKQPWFTETLDDGPSDPCVIASDDRCYASNFPRKAILVVTTDALYIFDAKDNVMWMKFSQNAAGWGLGVDTSNDPSSVFALNGVIYVGTHGTAGTGLYAFDFTSNRMWNYDSTDRSQGDVGIESRNSAVTYNVDSNTNYDLGNDTGWDKVNDVHAATIQSSSSGATAINGQVMVAIATDSGMGVINLTGQRYFAYSNTADNDYNAVFLTERAQLFGLNESTSELEKWLTIDTDQASEEGGTPNTFWNGTTSPSIAKGAVTILPNAPDALEIIERGSLADTTAANTPDLIYVGHSLGLTELHDQSTPSANAAWVKYFNTTEQTPFLPGTIQRAHLMGEASGDLTDSSIAGNTMAPKGSPIYGVSGVRGKAINFNNAGLFCSDNGGAACAEDADDDLTTVSWNMNMWFKHSITAAADILYSKCWNTTPARTVGCVELGMTASGTIMGGIDDDATNTTMSSYDRMATTTKTFNDNQWHFVSFSRLNAGDIVMTVDGILATLSGASIATTVEVAGQFVSIGGDCSVGAACATGNSFWDGSIDDFTISRGTTTTNSITQAQMRRMYNDARPLVNKRVITVDNATSSSSTTIADSGESWIVNEFSGMIVTLTGGTGSGQSRRVTSNTSDTLTVTPAWSTTPDTTTDFEVDPEALYGASNQVTSIGTLGDAAIGEARQMCVGTNSGTDTGGVTCYNHNAGPNLVADIYHADSEQIDDSGTEWTDDDVVSVDISGRNMVLASSGHFWTQNEDVRLGQGLDAISARIFDIRTELLVDGLNQLAQEVGLTGGADLAERYTSSDDLLAGNLVTLDANNVGAVKKSTGPYQNDLLGVVSTAPAVTLGPEEELAYPIALVGRVPVKVTAENGPIKAGDRLTSSSLPGYAMKATHAGRVIGTALDDLTAEKNETCPEETSEGTLCGSVTVFVNLVDYGGESVEIVMNDAQDSGMVWGDSILDPIIRWTSLPAGLTAEQVAIRQVQMEKADKILRYLAERRDSGEGNSEILTDRVSAGEVNGASIFAQEIFAASVTVDKLKANQIEGLEVFTDRISSLAAHQATQQNGETQSPDPAAIDQQLDLIDLNLQSAKVNLTLTVDGMFAANGGLTVRGQAQFNGETLFDKLVTFSDKTLFKGDTDFEGRITFNNDTGGFALIKKDQEKVDIKFDKPYDSSPIITVSVRNGQFVSFVYKEIFNDRSHKVEGFTIILKDPAEEDVEFAWTALNIKDPRTAQNPDPGAIN